MNKEEITKLIAEMDDYDDSRENTLRTMISEFYGRKMRLVMLWTWACFLVFLALAVVSGVMFFRSEETKSLIMFAAIFTSAVIGISYMKAWPMLVYVIKVTKRLEIRHAELIEALRQQ